MDYGASGPIILNTNYLQGSAEIHRRLHFLFNSWLNRHAAQIDNVPSYRDYLARYGRFSPLVLLPLGTNGPSTHHRLLLQLGHFDESEPSPKRPSRQIQRSILAGRVIPFDVEKDDFAREGPISNFLRFDAFMAKVLKTFEAILKYWSRRAVHVREERPPQQPHQPFHFVSYSRDDRTIVDPICSHLEALGIHLWIDRSALRTGEIWLDAIAQAIDNAAGVLPFCSPRFSASRMCQNEMLYAWEERKRIDPAWIIHPALQNGMRLLLGAFQAARVEGLPPDEAARIIHASLQ